MKTRPHFNFFKDSTVLYILPVVLYYPRLSSVGNATVQLRWLKWGISVWI